MAEPGFDPSDADRFSIAADNAALDRITFARTELEEAEAAYERLLDDDPRGRRELERRIHDMARQARSETASPTTTGS